jgi:hypothetical protein
MMSAQRDEETGLYVDMITYDTIPEDRLVLVTEGSTEYAFDIAALCRSYESNTKKGLCNPYTNQHFSPEIDARIRAYSEIHKIIVDVTTTDNNKKKRIYAPAFSQIGDVFCMLCSLRLGRLEYTLEHTAEITIGDRKMDIFTMDLEASLSELASNYIGIHMIPHTQTATERDTLVAFLKNHKDEIYASSLLSIIDTRPPEDHEEMMPDLEGQDIESLLSRLINIGARGGNHQRIVITTRREIDRFRELDEAIQIINSVNTPDRRSVIEAINTVEEICPGIGEDDRNFEQGRHVLNPELIPIIRNLTGGDCNSNILVKLRRLCITRRVQGNYRSGNTTSSRSRVSGM